MLALWCVEALIDPVIDSPKGGAVKGIDQYMTSMGIRHSLCAGLARDFIWVYLGRHNSEEKTTPSRAARRQCRMIPPNPLPKAAGHGFAALPVSHLVNQQ
ncbi:hypothetical protein MHYP_G00119260 [Metynnis hypsauchen]